MTWARGLEQTVKRFLPLTVGILSTAVVVIWTCFASLRQSGGHVVYGLDDAYIHMTVARTLAQHGVWGINPGEFAPASSSLLWVVILSAADRLAGVHEITSLLLNVAATV